MKVIDVLKIAEPMLRALNSAGASAADVNYVNLYNEATSMMLNGDKVTYVAAVLSAKYHISERTFHRIMGRLNMQVK